MKVAYFACALFGMFIAANAVVSAADAFEQRIRPLLSDHCLTCHSTEKQEGEFDLQQYVGETPRGDQVLSNEQAVVWGKVLEQLTIGEMPPKDARQLSPEQISEFKGWIRHALDQTALASAGDPGPVVLRRLSNREYTYTLRDLTGVDSLDPAREFPVDGAAGEGFTNAGAALVMSPALLRKYLDAAKEVSRHAILLPDGIRFSASDSPQDWTDAAITRLREFYRSHTVPTEVFSAVENAGQLAAEGGALPLESYFNALQGNGDPSGLSDKYLDGLRRKLNASEPNVLLDPLRSKLQQQSLTVADVEPWQKVLWQFSTVGHIGRTAGPKSWQVPASPLVERQQLRATLIENQDQTLYLVGGNAGDGDRGDTIVWQNPRLVSKGRPDLPIASLPELIRHLETLRERLLADTEKCLAAIAGSNSDADPELITLWRQYLGTGQTELTPLINDRLERTTDYDFIRGWTGANALSVLANSSDQLVRIPGIMPPHSVATHPAPDRESVIAWKTPTAGTFQVRGDIAHAHPECGNGVTWRVEVRRGAVTETLADGMSHGAERIMFGPFHNLSLDVGQVIAIVVGPRDGNHSCDMTSVNLTIDDGQDQWDLARDVSPNILAGNPHGPWHFLSQPTDRSLKSELPQPMIQWRNSPSTESAIKVREHLQNEFPLNHALLKPAIESFRGTHPSTEIVSAAPSAIELFIPAALASDAELIVDATLVAASQGSVQAWIRTEKPASPVTTAQPDTPVIVSTGSEASERFEADFAEFRNLFPRALCYTRIVPVDEVVTLTLYYREDEHLRRLVLDDSQSRELDRLWAELLFVSEAPLKQVNAYEQIYQFATQDRPDLVNEFGPLREPILKSAEQFKQFQLTADALQRDACVEFASQAWRRPLTESEIAELKQYPPRLMLTRILTSPAFLYRGEHAADQTGPVDDWEFATRISYFLWSSLPDQELRSVTASGRIRDQEVLGAQINRMLGDDKIRRLATEFGCQWLHVRDVATLDEKSERHFPTFVNVRSDMQEEVTRFFIDLFQNNRGVLTLLDADHTFVNQNLADHYGFEIESEDWQRIDGLRAKGRGGLLGFSATLAKHSGASRTSAILRGTWLSEVVLGDKLPNPPKGVPVLPEEPPAGLTERQLIELHSSDARCASCHRRIDPYGFALESFDAIGRARPADTKTTLYDGSTIDGLDGLRHYLVTERKDDFLKQFCRKLVGYALGRGVQLSDQPLIDAMSKSDGQRAEDLIRMIIHSSQFGRIRGRNETSL